MTCQHHDRNDIAFSPKSTFWKRNNGSFVEYSKGVVKSEAEETVLSITAEYGDTFACALKLQNSHKECHTLYLNIHQTARLDMSTLCLN